MSRHWAESRLFRYIRKLFGIEKPTAAQWGEWDDWETNTKIAHPVGYWVTEELPGYLQKIPETFVDPFHNISYYIRNRWHRQTHVLRTGFKPGTYHDLRERLLYGCMESLVDFIEVEKAWMAYICATDNEVVKLDRGRSAEAGLKYLEWEMSLDDPSLSDTERSDTQASCAREQFAIYNWWKNIRPNRPDPYEASGWDAFSEREREQGIDGLSFMDERKPRDPERDNIVGPMLDQIHAIEMAQDAEDEEMLIRLMKIRLSLWT
jgi:hypothetical protein